MKGHCVYRKPGRPKKDQSCLRKSYHKPLSDNTAGYTIARKRLDISLVNTVFEYSCDFGNFDKELWHGMKTCLTDGAYLQLQDTADIKREYFVKGQEDSYPQERGTYSSNGLREDMDMLMAQTGKHLIPHIKSKRRQFPIKTKR